MGTPHSLLTLEPAYQLKQAYMKIPIDLHSFKDGTLGDPGQFYISHPAFAPLGVNITI